MLRVDGDGNGVRRNPNINWRLKFLKFARTGGYFKHKTHFWIGIQSVLYGLCGGIHDGLSASWPVSFSQN